MKIAISATGPSLDAAMDQRFGRCAFFVVVEPDTMDSDSVPNVTATLGSGAGIQAARLLAEEGISTVLTGNCGPKAWDTLSAANIKVVVGCSGSVRDVVQQYKSGTFSPTEGPNVHGHAGERPTSNAPDSPIRVMGGGGGRGMGGGRGRGRGRGMGQSRGR